MEQHGAFVPVTPAQKKDMVRALQMRGHVVAKGDLSRTKESVNVGCFPSLQPWPASGSHGWRLWCTQCQTDVDLIIESIDTPMVYPASGE